MKKKIKKMRKVKQAKWLDFPQRSWEAWFSEFVVSRLAVEFYGQNKRWPRKINPSSLRIVENKDGSGTLSVDLT